MSPRRRSRARQGQNERPGALATPNPRLHHGMYRFYRKHYASRGNPLVNVAVYCGIGAKLGLALASNALRARRQGRAGGSEAPPAAD
jgi:hypothetical protein